MNAALAGILVADFSRVLAGPYASMLLADLGATVVKLERPDVGDDTRAWGPPFAADGQTTYFQSVNRNKLSVAVDLSDDSDVELARRLATEADVVLVNFRPNVMRHWGLDYESLRRSNPRVIYASLTGFGTGAGAQLPGYDLLVQATGGLMSVTGFDEPTKAGVAVVDVLAGLHITSAILAALFHRERHGEGQHVEVTLLGALLSGLVNQSAGVVGAGAVPGRMGNAHPSIAPYDVFSAADRPIVIAVGNDEQFNRFAAALDAPRLAADPRFATNTDRVAHREELSAEINAVLSARSAGHWQRVLTAVGVPCGTINDIAAAVALADDLGLDPVVSIDDPGSAPAQNHVANPARFSRTPVTYRHRAPQLDQDRAAVLEMLRSRGSR